jgi:hypothetical protein
MPSLVTKKAAPDRIRFVQQVVASEYAQFPPGTILELADGDTWPRQITGWIAGGQVERLAGDAVIPVDRPVAVVGAENFHQWFKRPPTPAVEPEPIATLDILQRFAWTRGEFELARACGFPKPISTRFRTRLTDTASLVDAEPIWRVRDVDAWELTLRRLLKGSQV